MNQAFANMADAEGVDIKYIPSILVRPSESFTVSIGGSKGYTIVGGILDRNSTEGIVIQSIVERYGETSL